MELEYLWIYNFREIFVNEGFNFSFSNNYQYNINTSILSRQILQPTHEKDFYHPKINALKGIIGKNGSGKSSILGFIKRNLANVKNGHSTHSEDGGFIAVFNDIILYKGCNIILDKELNGKYKIIEYSKSFERFQSFNNLNFIYYSNVFDSKYDDSEQPNLLSISTNYLLQVDSYTSEEKTVLYEYTYKEVKRQIDLISEITLPLGFNLPKSISISVSDNVKQHLKIIKDDEIEEIIVEQFGTIEKILTIDDFKRQVFRNFLKLLNFRDGISFTELGENLLVLLNNDFDSNFIKKLNIKSKKLYRAIRFIKSFFDVFNKLISSQQIDFVQNDHRTFLYYLKENNNDFYKFIETYNRIVLNDTFFYYSWEHEISSGEKSLLTFFSRFWYAKKSIEETSSHNQLKSLIILIDEGDLYLHPNWQKLLFKQLVTTLPIFFEKLDNIQLILTSHSPFIVSDIPSSDLIFLDRKDGPAFQTKLSVDENTFGANINNLYSDAFFMKDGLIGEFAKQVIFDLLEEIENVEITPNNLNSYLRRIEIIGEPLIREKLLTTLYENLTPNNLVDKKKILEEELKRIEYLLNNQGNEEGN